MPYFGFYWDNTYILVLLGAVIHDRLPVCSKAIMRNIAGYIRGPGITGAEAARRLLQSQGIYDVQVYQIAGELTDHYNIRER